METLKKLLVIALLALFASNSVNAASQRNANGAAKRRFVPGWARAQATGENSKQRRMRLRAEEREAALNALNQAVIEHASNYTTTAMTSSSDDRHDDGASRGGKRLRLPSSAVVSTDLVTTGARAEDAEEKGALIPFSHLDTTIALMDRTVDVAGEGSTTLTLVTENSDEKKAMTVKAICRELVRRVETRADRLPTSTKPLVAKFIFCALMKNLADLDTPILNMSDFRWRMIEVFGDVSANLRATTQLMLTGDFDAPFAIEEDAKHSLSLSSGSESLAYSAPLALTHKFIGPMPLVTRTEPTVHRLTYTPAPVMDQVPSRSLRERRVPKRSSSVEPTRVVSSRDGYAQRSRSAEPVRFRDLSDRFVLESKRAGSGQDSALGTPPASPRLFVDTNFDEDGAVVGHGPVAEVAPRQTPCGRLLNVLKRAPKAAAATAASLLLAAYAGSLVAMRCMPWSGPSENPDYSCGKGAMLTAAVGTAALGGACYLHKLSK